MIVPNQMVETRWVGANKNYYLAKGYVYSGIREKLFVKVEDLTPNSNARVAVRCDYCGKEYTISFSGYTKATSSGKDTCCTDCKPKYLLKWSKEDVEKAFIARGYTPLFDEYLLSHVKLNYVCPKHPEVVQWITHHDLKRGCGCYPCGREAAVSKMVGEQHHNWKGGISTENNVIRTSKEMTKWRLDVFHRDDFTCVRCGERGGDLNAHHILGFAEYHDLRFDLSNGATLCAGCHASAKHNSFHHTYGVKNNTLEQFTEFLATAKELIT